MINNSTKQQTKQKNRYDYHARELQFDFGDLLLNDLQASIYHKCLFFTNWFWSDNDECNPFDLTASILNE